MDTSLYSMGAYFSDEHPDLVGEVIAQSEAIERAGLRAYAEEHDMTAVGVLRDAAHRAGGALLQRRGGVGGPCPQENVDKAREFIEAYNRRDFDAAVAAFDPAVEWVLPERQSLDSCVGPAGDHGASGKGSTRPSRTSGWCRRSTSTPATAWPPGCAIAGAARGAASRSTRSSTTRSRPSGTGGCVRIEYFAEWSEALDGGGRLNGS